MELTREQQQFVLDALAYVCSKQHGVTLEFKLKEPEEEETSKES